MKRHFLFLAGIIPVCSALLTATIHADETLTSLGITPLTDMGGQLYKGQAGGLYPGGRNAPPEAHALGGMAASAGIVPRNRDGSESSTGKVVLISIGMSNTTQEFSKFKELADADAAKNPNLIVVDGAQVGCAVESWKDYGASTWVTLNQRLASAGVSTNQVQAAWIKLTVKYPSQYGEFPGHVNVFTSDLHKVVQNVKRRYPNIRIAYLSSRTRAYETNAATLNPEPYAFESAFGMKWIIESQIKGSAKLNCDPANGPVVAPYLRWGPYLWADGTNARSDGFTWPASCVRSDDFTHPSTEGMCVVADELLTFFKTDPTATPWFLKPATATNATVTCILSSDVSRGPKPLSVAFTATASSSAGPITSYLWTFNDGTFSTSPAPVKVFRTPGTYTVNLTVNDNGGNCATASLPITVDDVDSDGDGSFDLDEAIAGTDCNSASSVFKVQDVDSPASGKITLKWASVASKQYSISISTNLLEGFATIISGIAAKPPMNAWTSNIPASLNAMYRINVQQ